MAKLLCHIAKYYRVLSKWQSGIPSNSQRTGNEDKNDPKVGKLLIPYDFEVCHIVNSLKNVSGAAKSSTVGSVSLSDWLGGIA
jgi:hypothetical protein